MIKVLLLILNEHKEDGELILVNDTSEGCLLPEIELDSGDDLINSAISKLINVIGIVPDVVATDPIRHGENIFFIISYTRSRIEYPMHFQWYPINRMLREITVKNYREYLIQARNWLRDDNNSPNYLANNKHLMV
jgi:hypothetical protein